MGIRERQDRERHAVRKSILAAARDLFVHEGYANVSIRKIAERIEYSPAAIYSYFPGKDDIFFALAAEGFTRLDDAIREAAGDPDPLEDIRNCWWAFYRFSKEQREFFHLMFVDRSVPAITEQWQGFSLLQQMLERVAARIRRSIDAGRFPRSLDPQVALHVIWAAMMGPATLGCACRLAPGEDCDALARDVLETTIAGLAAGVPLSFVPCQPGHDASSPRSHAPGVSVHERS
jgi:AcrR family transcriptional regulator